MQIKYKWTKELLREALRYHSRLPFNPLRRGLRLAFGLLLIIFGLYIFSPAKNGLALLTIALGIFLLGLIRPFSVWWGLRGFDRRLDSNLDIIWKVTAEKLEVINAKSRSEIQWSIFRRALETPAGFLLYHIQEWFYYFPKSAFGTAEDLEAFDALIRKNIKIIKSVK